MANITYTREQKQEAAILYATVGSYAKVGRMLDIPKVTVHWWANNWDEWDALIEQVQTEKAKEHRAMYSRIVDEAQAHTLAKLPEATAAQANIIAATATDKIRLLDNQPTRITGQIDSIQGMADEFKSLAHAVRNQQVINVIDVTEGPHEQGPGRGKNQDQDNSDNPPSPAAIEQKDG
jgi:hypothetical protein